jgi:hypothetical protein
MQDLSDIGRLREAREVRALEVWSAPGYHLRTILLLFAFGLMGLFSRPLPV